MEGQSEIGLTGDSLDTGLLGRMREDEYESRSGSDNFDLEGLSGDDQDGGDDGQRKRKKRYHRHTPNQIQELESFFKECPHPDEKQRLDLSKRLGLENKQVKFWFQNRRTQMKTQLERHENIMLRQENDKLRGENSMMKEAMVNPICNNCGGPAIPGQILFEEHQIRIENARLKDELNRICALTNKFLGKPISSLANPMALPTSNSGLELGIGRNGFGGGSSSLGNPLPMGLDLGDGRSMPGISSPMGLMGSSSDVQLERSALIDLALAAMDELLKMAQTDSPVWIKGLDGERDMLNQEEYARLISSCIGPKPAGFVTEATRDTGIVIINSLALVETLMDANRYADMFQSMIARSANLDVLSGGIGGTRNGAIHLMHTEVQLLSPLVPVRQVRILRFCKQHAEGVWAVVDVSVEIGHDPSNAQPFISCRRLPSGCIVQDMPNGYSKVTWIEHWEYDESIVHQLYRPLLISGFGFGAHRWIATLQRQCEGLAILMSSSISNDDHTALSQAGRRSMLKLAQRMTNNFCSGVCASSARKWDSLQMGTLSDDMRVMTRKNVDDPGEPPGIVLSAATSVWTGTSASDSVESLQIHANKENIDPGEGWNPDPSAVDMNDDEDLTQSVSEELGNDLIEGQVANGDNEIDHQDICGSGNGCNEDVNNCGINSPHVSPKESSGCLVEQLHKLDDNNCVLSEDATVCLDASTGAKNIYEDTNLTVEEILDAVHSSSFENSSVQFPPIDPLREVETNDLAVHKMAATDTSGVQVVSEAPADDLMEEEVADVDDKFDLVEDVFETGNGTKEAINQGSIDCPHGSNVNNADLLHVSPVESSSPLVGGQVQKSDDNVMHNGDYDLGNCGFGIDILYSHEKSIAAEDTDAKTNVSMENLPYESHAPSVKLSEEFGKKLAEVEFDLLEDDCETACKDEALNSSSIKIPQGSILNDFNLLHDSLGDFSSYFDDEVQKPDDKIMHCGSGKSESGVDAFCFPDESIVAKNIDGKNNESMQKISYEGNSSSFQYSDGTQDLSMTTGELHSSSDLNTYPMAALDVCEEEMLKSSEKTCMVADPKECIGFSANDFEASTNKGFEAETCFDPNTLGDVVMETCNMNESMQIDTMEKVNSQGEGMNFFENSNVHDGVGAEDEPSETASRKRKRGDANSDEDVKDELVSTVPQTNEMELSNFRLQQLFASDTASGDEDAYQKKLVSPSKATPMIHKENIKFDKEDKVGSVMSRNKFAKRQPLQDLKQN